MGIAIISSIILFVHNLWYNDNIIFVYGIFFYYDLLNLLLNKGDKVESVNLVDKFNSLILWGIAFILMLAVLFLAYDNMIILNIILFSIYLLIILILISTYELYHKKVLKWK